MIQNLWRLIITHSVKEECVHKQQMNDLSSSL